MKRYIRTKDNKIWDKTIHKIESVTYLTVPTVEKYKLYIFNNHEELIGQYFCTDIIAESDNVFDLIQVGDLLERFSKDGNIQMLTRVINHEAEIKVIRSHDNITKIYTLQNENFILVWDKERGVI